MGDFIYVYSKRTGRKHRVPAHWVDIPALFKPFRKTPTQRADDGELALKGKALDDALEAAGLPKTGTADEKRAVLAAQQGSGSREPDPAGTPESLDDDSTPVDSDDTPHGGDQNKE